MWMRCDMPPNLCWKSGSQFSHYQWLRVIWTYKCRLLFSAKHEYIYIYIYICRDVIVRSISTYLIMSSLSPSQPICKNSRVHISATRVHRLPLVTCPGDSISFGACIIPVLFYELIMFYVYRDVYFNWYFTVFLYLTFTYQCARMFVRFHKLFCCAFECNIPAVKFLLLYIHCVSRKRGPLLHFQITPSNLDQYL